MALSSILSLCSDKEYRKRTLTGVCTDNRADVIDNYFASVFVFYHLCELVCIVDAVAVADKYSLIFGIYRGFLKLFEK